MFFSRKGVFFDWGTGPDWPGRPGPEKKSKKKSIFFLELPARRAGPAYPYTEFPCYGCIQ